MADSLLSSSTHPAARASHGRGGAGNIGPTINSATNPTNLTTPTIKSTIYTTGRGGSGNMKRNDPQHPEVARKSQDVEAPPTVRKGSESAGKGHTGRGGAANVLRAGSIDDVMYKNEHAVVEEGKQYERQRKASGSEGRQGDWWRDEMASGRVAGRS